MDSNVLQERAAKLEATIKELKTNQTIGGDSWVIYRYNLNYTAKAGQVNIVTFVPDIAGDFVARLFWAGTSSTWMDDNDILPDPNVNGKWYDCSYAANPVARTLFLMSTVKGKVYVT